MVREFEITLKIKVDTETTPVEPANWNWIALLDLAPDDNVEVINQTVLLEY